jgi:predicted amidohydrolase YtcJ
MLKRILTNAQVYSFTQDDQPADTVVIEEGHISAIGKASEIIPQFSSGAKIEDLRQSTLMPSFTDAHIHLLAYGLSLQRVNVETPTKRNCLDQIANCVKNTDSGKWIIGHGWNHNIWAAGYGSKKDLDNLSTQHPIYLTHKSLHSSWANSSALEKAGINHHTPDPEGGTIQRDTSGEPTGILLESAMSMVESAIPEPGVSERETAILEAQTALHRYGITAAHDFDPWSVYETLDDLHAKEKLSLRITKGIPKSFLDTAIRKKLKSGSGNDWIKIGWLKLFSDGALGPQTAAMISPYENLQSLGILLLSREDVTAYGEKALLNGIGLAVHAIGDRANQEVLLAMSDLKKKGMLKIPALKSRIEHVQLIQREDIQMFPALDVTASMQPLHAISDMDMADTYWGKRCADSYAWRSILQSGSQMIFGSDAPVESPNPFHGLHAAVSRKRLGSASKKEPSWIPKQCVNLQAALKAYISTPPTVGGFGMIIGKIKLGYAADFVLLPQDFFDLPLDDIQFVLPLATMASGKWVHKNDNIDIDFL